MTITQLFKDIENIKCPANTKDIRKMRKADLVAGFKKLKKIRTPKKKVVE